MLSRKRRFLKTIADTYQEFKKYLVAENNFHYNNENYNETVLKKWIKALIFIIVMEIIIMIVIFLLWL